MNLLLLLALLPIVQFVSLYIISKYRNTLHHLWNLYAVTVLDWVFVPFNYLVSYSITFSFTLFSIFLLVSIVPVILINIQWKNMKNKPKETKYFTTKDGMTPEGWIHLIFMMLQLSIVLTVIFSRAIYPYYLYLMLCILAYLIGYLSFIVFVRKVRLRSKIEFPYLIIAFVVIILRLLIKY
jgi:hypothetical protein